MAGASLGLSGGVSGSGSSVDGGASFGGVVMESVVCVLLFCALSEGVSYESLFDESSVGVVWESLFCVSNVGVMLESLSLASPEAVCQYRCLKCRWKCPCWCHFCCQEPFLFG